MTPEECAIKVVEQARAAIHNWFQHDVVKALEQAIADYDQSVARRMQPFVAPPPKDPVWPKTDGRPSGIGGNPCEGRCSTHGDCTGDVATYAVYGPIAGSYWGTFRYCETAKKSDEESGFRLERRI